MRNYRYILEPYRGRSTRYNCPKCGKSKVFARYIDTENSGHIHIHNDVGRCNRESSCGYHFTPKEFFQQNNIKIEPALRISTNGSSCKVKQANTSFISNEIFQKSLNGYGSNRFVRYLFGLFGDEVTNELIDRYKIGSSKHWPGATVFWQIDIKGKIRTGKVMLYDPQTGKRIKDPFSHINWVHSIMKLDDYELKQCLFGEHLLVNDTKPIAIVESEKTAIISSIYFPQFTWLAAGSLSNLNVEKCSVLKERSVFLFPDLNGYDKWSKKAKKLSEFTTCNVSDLLETKANEIDRKKGLDLADYLIRYDYNDFVSDSLENTIVELESIHESESIQYDNTIQTIGELFNWLKSRHQSLPDNISVNAPGWPGNEACFDSMHSKTSHQQNKYKKTRFSSAAQHFNNDGPF